MVNFSKLIMDLVWIHKFVERILILRVIMPIHTWTKDEWIYILQEFRNCYLLILRDICKPNCGLNLWIALQPQIRFNRKMRITKFTLVWTYITLGTGLLSQLVIGFLDGKNLITKIGKWRITEFISISSSQRKVNIHII